MQTHHHHKGAARVKQYRGRSHTKKSKQDCSVKKPTSSRKAKNQKNKSNPAKKYRRIYRFNPWWLISIHPLKAHAQQSTPVSIGMDCTLNIKGGPAA